MRLRPQPIGNPNFLAVTTEPLFDAPECDRLIERCREPWTPAGVTGYGRDPAASIRPNIRSVLSQPLPHDEDGWPLTRLAAAVARINDTVYRFSLTGFLDHDPPTVLQYESSVADHFQPHRDVGPEFATRKLSCVVQLTEPRDYTGGSLVFPEEHALAPSTRGSLTVFPSFLTHEVTPVVSGGRHVIVAWVHGPTFR